MNLVRLRTGTFGSNLRRQVFTIAKMLINTEYATCILTEENTTQDKNQP